MIVPSREYIMKISMQELSSMKKLSRVTIQSIDPCIYRMTVIIAGREKLITDNEGNTITSPNIQQLKEILAPWSIDELLLEHQSSYDEMIGHPPSTGNKLSTTLGQSVSGVDRTLN
jgi:Family of unknown function (DUF6482)